MARIIKVAIQLSLLTWLWVGAPAKLAAQQLNDCYEHFIKQGAEALEDKSYDLAIDRFEAARACLHDGESSFEIDNFIKTARRELNDALSDAKINSEVIRITAEALKAQPYDVTLALSLAHEACQLSGNKNELAVDVRKTILETAENQYYSSTLRPGGLVSSLAVSSDEKYLAVGLHNGEIKRVKLNGGPNEEWEQIGKSTTRNNAGSNYINSLAYAPNGEAVLTAAADSTVVLWPLNTAKPPKQVGLYYDRVTDVAFSPTGDTIATSSGYYMALWQFKYDSILVRLSFIKCRDIIRRIAYSPDGRFVLGTGNDHQVYWWDTGKTEPVILAGHNSEVTSIAISRDGEFFCTGSADGEAIIWRTDTKQIVRRLKGHQSGVSCIAFDPGNEYLLTGSFDKTVRLWDVEGNLVKVLKGHQTNVTAVAFVNRGKTIVSAGYEDQIRLWQLDAETLSQAYPHTAALYSACFSPDGRLVLTGSFDKTARLWQRDNGRLLHRFSYNDMVRSVAFHPNGRLMGIGVWDGNVSLRDTNGQLVNTIFGRASSVTGVNFSNKSNLFLSSHRGRTSILWNLPDEVIAELNYHTALVPAADFSFDDKYVISGSWDSTLVAFHIGQRDTITLHTKSYVTSLDVSPDKPEVVATLGDNTIILWNYIKRTWTAWPTPTFQTTIAFSPDGRQIATGDNYGNVTLWSPQGDSLFSFKAHSQVFSVCFSPDSKQLLTAGNDNMALLWNLKGELIRVYGGHNGPINAMAVSPDGQFIATGGYDGNVITWNRNRQITAIHSFGTYPITQLAVAPDQSVIVVTNDQHRLLLRNMKNKNADLITAEVPVDLVAFSPDGQTIAGASEGGQCWLFDKNGKVLKQLLKLEEYSIRALYFAGNNSTLEIGQNDRVLRYDLASGTATEIIFNGEYLGQNFAVTTTGDKTACSYNWDNIIRLFDNQGNVKEINVILPLSLAFDPAGTHLLCATDEGKTLLYDASSSNQSKMVLENFNLGNYERAAGVAFLGNSDTVVVCGIYSGPVFYRSYVKTLQKGANSFIQQLSLDQRQAYNIKLDFSDCYTSNNIELLKDCARYLKCITASALQLRQKIMQIKPSPQHKVDLALSYSTKLAEITEPADLVSGQQTVVQLLLEAYAESPRIPSYRRTLHLAYSNLSWYQILNGQFAEALKSVEAGLAVPGLEDIDRQLIHTNLALSLLCLGDKAHIERAKAVYREWKDKDWLVDFRFLTFAEAFEDDFNNVNIKQLTDKDPALKARVDDVRKNILGFID
ncbi:MAG: WD40 repeat domain-containing protein [Saprospiraceae bacterium]|nr:WD40 repeat domain-containing protein [Saprospiraceae bacterium]